MSDKAASAPFYVKAFEELRKAVNPIIRKYPELDACAIVAMWTVPSPVIPPGVVVGGTPEDERNITKMLDLAGRMSEASTALQLSVMRALSEHTTNATGQDNAPMRS